ncbi:hypothetical protein, partial [Micromonospora psammae]
GQPATPFVLGGGDAAAGPWPARPVEPTPPLSLTDRRRAALALSATVGRQPSRVRRTALVRSVGLLAALAAVLAIGRPDGPPPPVPPAVPAELGVGELELHAQSPEQVLTVGNRDGRPFRLTGLTVTGPSGGDVQVSADGCTTRPLDPGARCEIRLVVVPRTVGPLRASVELTADGRRLSTALVGTAAPRRASRDDAPPGPCYADAYQVGTSAYGYAGGLKAISVKQYWSPSCQASMAYVWVWKQYRDNASVGGGTWSVELAVRTDRPTSRQRAGGQPYELWTEPYRPAGRCTTATATVTSARSEEVSVATTEPYCGR